MAEHLRRRRAPYVIAVIPALIGLPLAYAVGAFPEVNQLRGGALAQALVPYLTLGWLVAWILASRGKPAFPPAS